MTSIFRQKIPNVNSWTISPIFWPSLNFLFSVVFLSRVLLSISMWTLKLQPPYRNRTDILAMTFSLFLAPSREGKNCLCTVCRESTSTNIDISWLNNQSIVHRLPQNVTHVHTYEEKQFTLLQKSHALLLDRVNSSSWLEDKARNMTWFVRLVYEWWLEG